MYGSTGKNRLTLRAAALFGLLAIQVMIIAPSFLSLQPAVQTARAATVLTSKWSRSSLGSNWEGGLVIGDVTGDGVEDVVFAGGGSDRVVVLNGKTGATIATYTNTRIGQYCQPQLYDVDGDGRLDILVPLYYLPGLAAVKYAGTATLSQMWIANVEGSSGSGSVMAKPVAGDIDGDGHLDIFIGAQDVAPAGGYDGTLSRINYLGTIVAQTFTWRPCSGGLSLADTDNDGVFELYQGDRQMGYSDGGYGKGLRSFWANNLTERWNRLDFLSSSQSPVLADVNGDGVKDVLAGMYREMNILNSSNGEMIKKWTGGVASVISVHYGFTVYDIDADGNLELLCSDGDHDNDQYVDVFDLVTGQMDAQLYLGRYSSTRVYDEKWSALVANIYSNGNNPDGSPRMEIITGANTTSTSGSNTAVLLVYDNKYNLLQNMTGLTGQIGYSFVQDIDADGLLELVTDSSTGRVYAYDTTTSAPSGSQRIRSDVTYFGESRLGVAEHTIIPGKAGYWTAPVVGPVSPAENALAVPISTNQLRFRLRDEQSKSLTYSATTTPSIGSTSGSISGPDAYNWNTITFNVAGLAYDTTYRWSVTASDGSQVMKRTYTFRTALAPNAGNSPPTQGTPTMTATDGVGSTSSTFRTTAQGTSDPNGNAVTNIYRWTVDAAPVAQLLLPFDTRGEGTTADYSGFGNNGQVIGATWVSNGKVGGAYRFDGKDDVIKISDGGAGYFNDKNFTTNNEELGGLGDWNAVTVEAWIYLTENNYGTRFIAKIPSYSLGFRSNQVNQLTASVWPMGFQIATDENKASTDRERSVSYSTSLSLNTWYHVAFSYQSGVGLKLYVNGALVAESSAYTGPVKISRGEPLYIGRLVEPFAGMIDEVRLYNYAVPAAQISNGYTESKDGSSSSSLFRPSGIAAAGDTLGCDVIPTDSYAEGTTRSTSMIIQDGGSIEYTLTVSIVGSGTVSKSPNLASYPDGSVVTLTASPASGWSFSGWSGGLTGTANPGTITVNGNKAVTATFSQSQGSVFEDGFESGSFSAWTGTSVTSGETASVVTTLPHSGMYSAMFKSNGGGTYERACSYRTITAANELRTSAYVYVSGTGITVNSARLYFIVLRDSAGNNIGYAGWGRYTNGVTYWYVMIRSGTGLVTARSTATPSVNTWYNVEFHWRRDSTVGLGELLVNGVVVCQVTNANTAQYGGVTSVRLGIAETGSIAVAATVYVDDARIVTIA